jgi:hypothetical protein
VPVVSVVAVVTVVAVVAVVPVVVGEVRVWVSKHTRSANARVGTSCYRHPIKHYETAHKKTL